MSWRRRPDRCGHCLFAEKTHADGKGAASQRPRRTDKLDGRRQRPPCFAAKRAEVEKNNPSLFRPSVAFLRCRSILYHAPGKKASSASATGWRCSGIPASAARCVHAFLYERLASEDRLN